MKTFINLLTEIELGNILSLTEVQIAKKQLDKQNNVYFTISTLSDDIKNKIESIFNLSLPKNIPMRWIQGDTKPHIDRGIESFENTHLLYITDSKGSLVVDNIKYPIQKGSVYIFPENSYHETINTGIIPRLLLGPMSEQGLSVGGISGISVPGNTIINVMSVNGIIQYSLNNENNMSVLEFPCILVNTSPNVGFIEVRFITDITLTFTNQYFIIGSEKIKIGSTNLNQDGTCPKITINTDSYDGLVENGIENQNGYSNITIQNLIVDGNEYSTQIGAGWFGKKYYGRGSVNNYFINCTSKGYIAENAGGIVGSFASNYNSSLIIINCSSSGNIGNGGGGIIGSSSAQMGGSIYISQCFSYGSIGDQSGGICGSNSGTNNGNFSVMNCFSIGNINNAGGGISGSSCGGGDGYVLISNCYSRGNINTSAGGICAINTSNTTLNNCYSTGIINPTNAGGLFGMFSYNSSAVFCYISGGNNFFGTTGTPPDITSCVYDELGWNTTSANTVLQGTPLNETNVGQYWVFNGINQPYLLYEMGYTPYTITNISGNNIVRTYSSTVVRGNNTNAAIISGKSYEIIQFSGGNPSSYESITINNTTGVVSTMPITKSGVYTLYIKNIGTHVNEWFTTTLVITVIDPIVKKNLDGFGIRKGNNEEFNNLLFN